jgi:hypothetical protein
MTSLINLTTAFVLVSYWLYSVFKKDKNINKMVIHSSYYVLSILSSVFSLSLMAVTIVGMVIGAIEASWHLNIVSLVFIVLSDFFKNKSY